MRVSEDLVKQKGGPARAQAQIPLQRVVVLIAISAPIVLGFEALLREFVFIPMVGADLEQLREFYWPALTDEVRESAMTKLAWAFAGASVLAGLLGVALMTRAGRGEAARPKVRDRLLLLSSIPQVPAILATLCFSFGASLTPVLGSIGISTLFVLIQGLVGTEGGQRRLAAIPEFEHGSELR